VRKALFLERMYEGLERRSKERPIVASLARLAADKTISDESFESEKAAKQMAEAIRKDSNDANLVFKIEADGEAHFRAVFSHTQNGARPPTVVDMTLLRTGEMREIRRLGPELESIKAPYKLKNGDIVEINVDARTLRAELSNSEMALRRARWKPPTPKYRHGVFAKYARLVTSASLGAVCIPE